MSAVLKHQFTFEEYLAKERVAEGKSEYYRGQIFAMSGGSPRHNTISVNISSSLRGRLRGSPCRPFNSDQRIRIQANGLATYPDVSVVCGEFQVNSVDRDAIVNPRVFFEVLSQSTESYDRGKTFELSRQLDSLEEYVLVSQGEALIERFSRQEYGSWLLTVFKGLNASLGPSFLSSVSFLDRVRISQTEISVNGTASIQYGTINMVSQTPTTR
jgi:Uma2 family endonuclease